jgi:hypothetical protein
MDDGKRFYERTAFWPRLIGAIFGLFFLIVFHSELFILLRVIWAIIQSLMLRPVSVLPADTPRALIVLVINLVSYLVCYFIILRWVSLFVLPAQKPEERRKVYERLSEYVFGLHGPAVFVKNGELITRKGEVYAEEGIKARFASLALVDLSSAIVLERRSLPAFINLSGESTTTSGRRQLIRVLGPGIGFLQPGERIRSTVDLRKQVRTMKGVHGFTSDGIELVTNVNVVFSLGQPPEVLTVFDTRENGLRVMTIDKKTSKITKIDDALDDGDAREIYANMQGQKRTRTTELAFENPTSSRPPFVFNENHIIEAMISQPRNPSSGKLEKWTDLPAQAAVSILLDELSRVSYNHLYSLDHPGPGCYLYDRFKPLFNRKIAHQGVLSYQLVQRKDGSLPAVGGLFNLDEYIAWEVMELHSSKPIRDRGIKVIDAGFSDFQPIDNTIPEQRFDTWRSQWQKKTELTNAEYDLEVMRNMNHEHARAQREIIYNLSQIFKLPGYTQDAMAIRIFEALESAAANPATNRLLPRDTVDMLRNFQRLLFTHGLDGQALDDQNYDGGR